MIINDFFQFIIQFNAYLKFLEPKMVFSNDFYSLAVNIKSKYIQFTSVIKTDAAMTQI